MHGWATTMAPYSNEAILKWAPSLRNEHFPSALAISKSEFSNKEAKYLCLFHLVQTDEIDWLHD